MIGPQRTRFINDVRHELENQDQKGWNDEFNSPGLWVAKIVNHVSRWAMPASFDTQKYTFYRCMVKTAALCCSAAVWFVRNKIDAEVETEERPAAVAGGVE